MIVKSLNYWSSPNGLTGEVPIADFLALAKRHRFDAVELCIGDSGALHTQSTESECRSIRAMAEDLGVPVLSTASGLYWFKNIGDEDPDLRRTAEDDLKRMLEIASWLGAKTHLTIVGAVDVFFRPDRPLQRYDEVWKRAQEGLHRVLPTAAAAQVRIGLENVWNKFLLSPVEMLTFLGQCDSPWLGAYLDVANVLPYGYPEQWILALGRKIVGVHFKDFRRAVGTVEGFVDLLEGDVDWPAVMAALREVGYAGPVPAELIPNYRLAPEVRVANASNAMDAILAM